MEIFPWVGAGVRWKAEDAEREVFCVISGYSLLSEQDLPRAGNPWTNVMADSLLLWPSSRSRRVQSDAQTSFGTVGATYADPIQEGPTLTGSVRKYFSTDYSN